jgi:RHS repeat-associated protein
MGYDGLDLWIGDRRQRHLGGNGTFGYDPLDNLRTSTVGARSTVANIDGANRISSLGVNGTAMGFGYDANGNITQRGAQGFGFDIGNRLSSATGKASYSYDGLGRRMLVAYTNGATRLQAYGQAGQLLYGSHSSEGSTQHIYLGDRLIAEVNSVSGTSYVHTDALGSPIARTNGSRAVTAKTRYEPYGATAAGNAPKGIGFTGHVNDLDTGLVYMQQRYYDPIAGRFLSVDPVITDANTGSSFNRYFYANNSPYKYVNPDGRNSLIPDEAGDGTAGVIVPRSISGAAVHTSRQQALQNLGAAREKWATQTVVPRTGPKGVDSSHHNANVTIRDPAGNVVHHERIVSGNMTPAERALGFPRGSLASHTEARAVRNNTLQAGQSMTITGQNPPCPSCK